MRKSRLVIAVAIGATIIASPLRVQRPGQKQAPGGHITGASSAPIPWETPR